LVELKVECNAGVESGQMEEKRRSERLKEEPKTQVLNSEPGAPANGTENLTQRTQREEHSGHREEQKFKSAKVKE